MFNSLPGSTQRRLLFALAIAALVGGLAAMSTLVLAGLAFLLVQLNHADPLALYQPDPRAAALLVPHGALGGAAWAALLTAYGGLGMGAIAFAVLFLGRANAN